MCDYEDCKKPAKYNLQNWWHLYELDKDGEYTEIKDWEGDSNEHYCAEHANIELDLRVDEDDE